MDQEHAAMFTVLCVWTAMPTFLLFRIERVKTLPVAHVTQVSMEILTTAIHVQVYANQKCKDTCTNTLKAIQKRYVVVQTLSREVRILGISQKKIYRVKFMNQVPSVKAFFFFMSTSIL